jgi:hypothetical protein
MRTETIRAKIAEMQEVKKTYARERWVGRSLGWSKGFIVALICLRLLVFSC